MNTINVVSLSCALLVAGTMVATAQSGGAATRETVTAPQRFVGSCLSQDENGRDLPNPNASSICGQNREMSSECAKQERLGNTKALALHCFGFDAVAKADPAPTAPARYTAGKRR